MAANNRELEEKTNKIAGKKIEEGQEPQSFQEAQNHLLQVQAAQNENLQVERAISGAQAQNNQTMAQAAELMAMSNAEGGGPVQGRGVQLNPQTQAILGKYGYGKPRTQTSTSSNSGPVQGRGIVINNRTENKTTNNVQVSTPPAQITKTSGDGGMAKFKTWMTSNLASQKEQEAIRERNYQRKEWSLSRSSKKMMERLEELGKTIGENLDPRKVGTVLMDQLKVLLFLLGFQFLSKNWDKILKTADKVEAWLRGVAEYFGVKIGDGKGGFEISFTEGKSEFTKDLIRLFGGDPDTESVGDALGALIKEGFDLLIDKFKIMMSERAEAARSIKFPDIDLTDIGGTLRAVGSYLADILMCLVSGKEGLLHNISNNIEATGRVSSLNQDAEWAKPNALGVNDESNIDDTSWGDANILGKEGQDTMNIIDYNQSGGLANNMESSVRQASTIASMINDNATGVVHTAGVMTGLKNLQESAELNGGTLVKRDFLEALSKLGVKVDDVGKKEGVYKFVKREKTEEEKSKEHMSVLGNAITKGAMGAGAGALMGSIAPGAGTISGGLIGAGVGFLGGAIEAWVNNASKNKYTLEMVPKDAPGTPEKVNYRDYYGKVRSDTYFRFPILTPDDINKIKTRLEALTGMEEGTLQFGGESEESMQKIDELLTQHKKSLTPKTKIVGTGAFARIGPRYEEHEIQSDYNKSAYQAYHILKDRVDAQNAAWNERYNNSRFKAGIDYAKDKVVSAVEDLTNGKLITSDEVESAINILEKHEGFEEEPYELGDGHQTIGFGFTRANVPEAEEYFKKGHITREEAKPILKKLAIQKKNLIKKQIGEDNWNKLTVSQKAALIDVAYHGGSLGENLVSAIKNGDNEVIKRNLRPLGSDDDWRKFGKAWNQRWYNRMALWDYNNSKTTSSASNTTAPKEKTKQPSIDYSKPRAGNDGYEQLQKSSQDFYDNNPNMKVFSTTLGQPQASVTPKTTTQTSYSLPSYNTSYGSGDIAYNIKGSTGDNEIISKLGEIKRSIDNQGGSVVMLSKAVSDLAYANTTTGNTYNTITNNIPRSDKSFTDDNSVGGNWGSSFG